MALFDTFFKNPSAVPEMASSISPMQAMVDALYEQGGYDRENPLKLDRLVDAALERGLAPAQIADMRGVDFHGAVCFTDTGIDRLRALGVGDTNQPNAPVLDVRGANLNGLTFEPASVCQDVIFDQVVAGGDKDHLRNTGQLADETPTQMQGLRFSGFDDAPATLSMHGGDISFAEIRGHDGCASRHMTLDLHGTVAQGMDCAGSRFTQIMARQDESSQPADLTALRCTSAMALKMDAEGCELSGAHFEGVSFAPDGQMSQCNLIGANFSGASLSNMDFSGSRMYGCDLNGVELGGANWQGVEIRASDLRGALISGEPVNTIAQAQGFMREQGMVEPDRSVAVDIDAVGEQVANINRARAGHGIALMPVDAPGIKPGQCELSETDRLIAAISAVHSALGSEGVFRGCADMQHDRDLVQPGGGIAPDVALAQFRRESESRSLA